MLLALLAALAPIGANAAQVIILSSGKEIDGNIISVEQGKTTVLDAAGHTLLLPTASIVGIRVDGDLVSGPPDVDFPKRHPPGAAEKTVGRTAAEPALNPDLTEAWKLRSEASTQLSIGGALMVAGFVIQTIGASGKDKLLFITLVPAGFIARQVALPVLGFGADKAGGAARKIDPEYEDGNAGWGGYLATEILTGMAAALVLVPPLAFDAKGGDYAPFAILGLGALVAADIVSCTSWYHFRHRANLSLRAMESQRDAADFRLELQPLVSLDERGAPAGGLALNLAF